MGVRTNTELKIEVGLDNTLDDCLFERSFTALLDTLDHATSQVLTLEAAQSGLSIPFGDVAEARLVYIEANGEFEVNLGGIAEAAAVVTAVGGSYPTGFAGGETLLMEVDNVSTPVTFDDADETIGAVINRINAAVALAGLATPVAADVAGQIRLTSPTTGIASEIDITGGTGLATLGLSIAVTNGANGTPGTSDLAIERPADPAGASAAAGVLSYFLATVKTTSISVSNPSLTADLRLRILVAGDLL